MVLRAGGAGGSRDVSAGGCRWAGSGEHARGVALGTFRGAGGPSGGCGDGPAVLVGEAEREEPLQVHGGAAVGPAEPVAFGSSVAETPVVVFDEPGDGAFDHGLVLAVGVGAGEEAARRRRHTARCSGADAAFISGCGTR